MVSLKAEKRTVFGKLLKKSRAAGQLPIVVYGPKEATGSFFVDTKEFKKVLAEAGESTVVSLTTPDGDKDVLIHDIAYEPVRGEPVHADLYAIEKGKAIEVDVPLEFTGVSPAVKDLAGILVKVLHELKIEALPKDLPHEITVDIAKLVNLDSQILVSDLVIPTGVTVSNGPEEVVAAIDVAKEEVEEPVAAPDLSSIEVEKKGKKEEEGGESAEAPAADAPKEK